MNGINLDQLFSSGQLILGTSFGPAEIALSLVVTFLVAMFIYLIYRYTYAGVLYSKSFNITLVMTALVVNMIMIGISGNIALSLGMLGALSVIRFRTAVKDPKDVGFLFWAIGVGIVNGVAFYDLAIISSVFIAVVLVVLSKLPAQSSSYVLVLSYSGDEKNINSVLDKRCSKYNIRSDSRKQDETERVVEVKIKENQQDKLLSEMKNVEGVDKCILLSSEGEIAE